MATLDFVTELPVGHGEKEANCGTLAEGIITLAEADGPLQGWRKKKPELLSQNRRPGLVVSGEMAMMVSGAGTDSIFTWHNRVKRPKKQTPRNGYLMQPILQTFSNASGQVFEFYLQLPSRDLNLQVTRFR
jgi:hypothetical protein